ncbi:hypothetical protein [Nocardia heshunensis]
MESVLAEIVAAAEVLLHGRPELIDYVRQCAAGLPGEDLDIPASEWESLARHELNQSLTEPTPFDDGPALAAHLDHNCDPEYLQRALQGLSSHPESLEWQWVPDFVAPLSEAGWRDGEIAEKLLQEIGDRCLRIGAALVGLTELRSADASDMLELLFIDAEAVDRLDAMSAAIGRRVELWRNR